MVLHDMVLHDMVLHDMVWSMRDAWCNVSKPPSKEEEL
jgi:hypothetical protein